MKYVFAIAALKGLCVLACICGAIYLMQMDKNGWGWLLFIAVIVCPSLEFKSKDNDQGSTK